MIDKRFNTYQDILRLLSNDRNIRFIYENNNIVLDLSQENIYLRDTFLDIINKK